MNVNGFIGIFGFAAIWVFCRIFCSWLLRLSYTSAGESVRSAEKRYDLMKRGLLPKKKEIDWLAEVSLRPMTTRFLYFAFYLLTALPVLGILISAVDIFVPALNVVINKVLNVLFLVPFVSVFLYLFLNDPAEYIMKKRDRRKRGERQ